MITIANKFYAHLNAYGVDAAVADGKAWYPNAWNVCKHIGGQFGVAPKRVAAVMAVTSPRARWATNIFATHAIVRDAVKSGEFAVSYNILPANSQKAIRIMTSRYYANVLSGPKVSAFYDAICGDVDSVTVDSLMSKAAGYGSDVSDRIREEVTTACWQIGDVFGLSPRDAQAAVWCAYRGAAA